MSRHDRLRARRWSAAVTVAAAGLAGWFFFFRGPGASADSSAGAAPPPTPTVEAKAEPAKPAPKPEPRPAPKKVEAPPAKPVSVSVATPVQEPKPEPAPWRHLLETGRHQEARRYMAEAFAATDSDALRAEIAEKGIAKGSTRWLVRMTSLTASGGAFGVTVMTRLALSVSSSASLIT